MCKRNYLHKVGNRSSDVDIINNINQVLNQMNAIESMAKSQVSAESTTTQPQGSSFAGMMQQAIDQVNQSQAQARELGQALEMGDPNVDIAQVMSFKAAFELCDD